MRFKFSKNNVLRSHALIEKVFAEGTVIKAYPLKLIWLPVDPDGETCQVLFAISKKNIRRAVNRNLIRRRLREIWRKNLPVLLEELAKRNCCLAIAVVYGEKELLEYSELESKMKVLMTKFLKSLPAPDTEGV